MEGRDLHPIIINRGRFPPTLTPQEPDNCSRYLEAAVAVFPAEVPVSFYEADVFSGIAFFFRGGGGEGRTLLVNGPHFPNFQLLGNG